MPDFDPDSLLTAPAPASAAMKITPPKKLSYDDIVARAKAQGYSDAGARGIADNFERESGGNPAIDYGDSGTSSGLAQWHNTRKTDLLNFAKAQGKPWSDPDVQFAFFDKEMREQYPTLRTSLMNATDQSEAEDQFKRIYERPKSVLWANDPKGGPVLGNNRYRFNDDLFAGDDTHLMSPADYLALSPPLEDTPAAAKQWRDLRVSVGAGDPILKAPSLDVTTAGPTGTVTAQDGRNRALLAQEAGIDAIPVQINQTGTGKPTEFVGMSGNVVPAHDVVPANTAAMEKRGESILARLGIVGSAEAAEPKSDWGNDPLVAQGAPAAPQEAGGWGDDPLVSTPGALPQAGIMERIGTGARDVLEGGAQLLRNATPEAIRGPIDRLNATLGMGPLPTNENEAAREKSIEATQGAGFDPARAAGNVLATLPLARFSPMAAGAASAALQPVTGDNFWREKAEQTILGGAAGGAGQLIGNAMSRMMAPVMRPAAQMLHDLGVALTPGQMAGGVQQRAENALASLPVVGSLIRSAEKKGIDQFNTGLLNKALEPVGRALPAGIPAGREAIGVAQEIASDAYDRALQGVVFKGDQILATEMQDLRNLVSEMPASHQQQFENILRNRVLQRMQPTGTMDGQTFKQVESELGNLANGFRSSRDMADQQLGNALKQVRELAREALERSNPGKRAEIAAANQTYAMLSRIEDASMNRATADGVFTPADLLRSIRANARRTGNRKLFARGDAALQDIAEAGQDVLPSKVPDSGTPERAMWAGLVGGAYFAHPGVAAGLGAASLPYLLPPGGRNALAQLSRAGPRVLAPALGVAAADLGPQR